MINSLKEKKIIKHSFLFPYVISISNFLFTSLKGEQVVVIAVDIKANLGAFISMKVKVSPGL